MHSANAYPPPDEALLGLLVCPLCHGALDRSPDALSCGPCDRRFPIVLGIPDLRLHEDPLIPLADDYRKGEVLQAAAETRTFAELVAYYWTLPTYPPTPPALASRFIDHVLSDATRIAAYEHRLGRGDLMLDVGCGAGVLVRTAHRHYRQVIGCDVGFRWLVVARRGLLEAGLPAHLVCACADHLPFPDGRFDLVTSLALLEHLRQPSSTLDQMQRVLRPLGRVFVWTTNRFSLAPEPHVGLWGVGYLPRRWQARYVRWKSGLAYDHKRLVGRRELSRLLRRSGFRSLRYQVPAITRADLLHRSRGERMAGIVANLARRVPGLGALLTWIAPALQVVGRRRS